MEIDQFLGPGDLLVINQTRVMKARCRAHKLTGGAVEVFFLGVPSQGESWQVLLRPSKRVPVNSVLEFPRSQCRVTVREKHPTGGATIDGLSLAQFERVLDLDGELPLPPYIKRQAGPSAQDDDRYQTVYARDLGAVAAPTAGLHFTPQVLQRLEDRGIEIARITHHVGIGTFKPLQADDIRDHQMEQEHYEIDEKAAFALNRARTDGRRTVAVGTTTTRCLESNLTDRGFQSGRFSTGLYIYPGYSFKAIQALITNFHLPGSSLMLLVCALMGRTAMLDLYRVAVDQRYRFYSYGDAMLLVP